MNYLIAYLIIINIISFFLYGLDKKKAEKGKWRIKETTLLLFSLIGGGVGSILGMRFFRHKTQKNKFKFGVPILTIMSIGIIYLVVVYYIL
ncbi:MAG: DUF1294 domain-containing protein [Acholeplasmataceae bacterium]|nr:DUF1294 domain-containing protein [Acholeplasmataceae bacterium]